MSIAGVRIDRRWTGLIALQLLLTAPFAGRPLHMDDPIYLDVGRNALERPWHAQDFPYCFEGRCYADMGSHSHPPLTGYWIAALLWLFGDGARAATILHLGFLIFPVLFAAGMYGLAQRFSPSPQTAALAAIVSPAAVVMSHGLMADFPTLALWTAGMALYIHGVDRLRPAWVWTSAAFLALAAFASYPALAAAVLCWLYAALRRVRMRAAWAAPLLPMAWMGLWLTYSSLYFGRFVLSGTTEYFLETQRSWDPLRMLEKLVGVPIMVAGVITVPWPLVRRAFDGAGRIAALLWAGASPLLLYFGAGYTGGALLLGTVLLALGGWVLIGLFREAARGPGLRTDVRRDAIFLSAWAVLALALNVFVYSNGAARYLLPLLPPLALMAFSRPPGTPPRSRRLEAACIAAALALSAALSIADYDIARAHRDIAARVDANFGEWAGSVRFGGEWGLRHHMLERGFTQFLSKSEDLAGGQLLVIPREAVPYEPPQDVATMLVPVTRIAWTSRFPVRLMARSAHAGFYSTGWGLLPFSFSEDSVEEVAVSQVSYLVERLPEAAVDSAVIGATAIPQPAPGGGADLVVPAPGRLRIPYDGPLPARVRFSCVLPEAGPAAECPVRAAWEGAVSRRSLELAPAASGAHYFDIETKEAGTIVLEVAPHPEGRVLIRNWTMLPPGAAL